MEIKYDTPTLLYASMMDDALKKLENCFHINFFHFARRIKGATPFSISTNRTWHLKYKQEYEHNDSFMDQNKIQKYKNIYLWGSEGFKTKKENMMHEERTKSFCIPPGISLISENENYTDTFSFSSSMIFQDRINILLNQSNDLLKFGKDFTKDIQPIISEYIKKNALYINNKYIQPIFPENQKEKKLHIPTYANISEQICYKELFTLRQIECIYCTAHGLTSAKTSKILNISKRTVEGILNSAIVKLGCSNRYQLVYQTAKFGLIMDDMISPSIKLKIEQELNSEF